MLYVPKLKQHPCLGHTLHLCLEEIIFPRQGKQVLLEETSAVIERCRSIATLFKRSPSVWNAYAKVYLAETGSEPVKILRDCITRWCSSLPVIEKVIQQAEHLEIAALKLKRPARNIAAEDKMLLKEVSEMLKPFQEATTILSEAKYPPASLIVPTVVRIHRALGKTEVKSEPGSKMNDCLFKLRE
ncbi:UNVERIFIED_CONTAM: hypothetical protein FKN15_035724 [Acipenser sinensis]